mmetsp:Transcript_24818/g.29304  ORF Transcript_24818/g.29304 Transcript_24818/m.29304 type:complete len:118 (+) Transcript_24818:52-405(+)
MATKNNWAHSCCSESALNSAIQNDSIKFIESDIVISSRTGKPCMAHPPANDSKFTFSQFLKLAAPSGKGLKLDFKDQAAVSPCLKEVRNLDQQGGIKSDQTIWLNADILCGPGGISL